MAPYPTNLIATALRPPQWRSPRFPVSGDLNMATVLEAIGYNPVKGPTANIIGFPGANGSIPFGHSCSRRFIATPDPPIISLKSSFLSSVQNLFRERSMCRMFERVSFILFDFLHFDYVIFTVIGAVATVNAYARFLYRL